MGGGTIYNILYADTVLGSAEIKDKKLRLSIELTLGGFSFSVKNTTDDIYLLAGHTDIKYGSSYSRVLQSLIETFETREEIKHLQFDQAEIIYGDAIYTTLPAELYDSTHKTDYLSFSVGRDLTHDNNISVQEIPTHDAVCIFQTQDKITDYIATRAAKITSYHSSALFLEHLQHFQTPGTHLHVYLMPTDMTVAAFTDGKLMAVNTYQMKDRASFAYYLLSLCNKLGVNERSTPITLYGSPEEYVRQHDALSRYFPSARYAERYTGARFSQALDFVATYEYYNILNH